MTHLFPRLTTLFAASALAAGCALTPTAVQFQHSFVPANSGPVASGLDSSGDRSKYPALIAIAGNGALELFPMRRGGDNHPLTLTKPGFVVGQSMVANGHVVAIANEDPAEVLVYNVVTKSEKKLPDPFGIPIDIAIGKDMSFYVINYDNTGTNVVMYLGGAPNPQKLVCKYQHIGEEIAVDNEGDIFVNGYKRDNSAGVIEIPNGPRGPEPQHCFQLHLQSEPGYTAGLGVDPKTDALVVLDNPDDCAGGVEGRMTIYRKPYKASTGQVHFLGANCAGGLRLNRGSTIVFVGDRDVSGSYSFVLQRSYPDGRDDGSYLGHSPGGFTTIPNTLPN